MWGQNDVESSSFEIQFENPSPFNGPTDPFEKTVVFAGRLFFHLRN